MKLNFLKNDSLLGIIATSTLGLMTPMNLSFMWNMGSLLIVCMMVQLISGILLAGFYTVSMENSFYFLLKFMENIYDGWFIRYIHANGASFFFFCLFIHMGRGLYYSSYMMKNTWLSGVTIFMMTMAAAFLGYVLPLNQMSFWGASVITSLFSEFPVIGKELVKILWGGMGVIEVTVSRFFSLHFLLPFVLLFFIFLHIVFLHEKGSNNPMGLNSYSSKLIFNPHYSMKDIFGALIFFIFFFMVCLCKPLMLGDDDNFNVADPSITPIHIQPEWYFLFAYAILRSIPSKLGGVIALLMAVLIFYSLVFTYMNNKKTIYFSFSKILYWSFILNFIILTWIGMRAAEEPYIIIGQTFSITYFLFFFLFPLSLK